MLIAHPQELALYSRAQRQAILLGDFYYVTGQFDRAIGVYQDLLQGRFDKLKAEQTDYPSFAIGLCRLRAGNARQAIAQWQRVLAQNNVTWTRWRAALAIARQARFVADKEIRAQGELLLRELAEAGVDNDYTLQARMILAMDLADAGKTNDAVTLLKRIRQSHNAYYALAQYLIDNNGMLRGPDLPPANDPGANHKLDRPWEHLAIEQEGIDQTTPQSEDDASGQVARPNAPDFFGITTEP